MLSCLARTHVCLGHLYVAHVVAVLSLDVPHTLARVPCAHRRSRLTRAHMCITGEREAVAAARDADAVQGSAAAKRAAALEDTVRAKDAEMARLSEELGALRQGKADMELRLAEHERGALALEQEKRDLGGQLDALRSELQQTQVRGT